MKIIENFLHNEQFNIIKEELLSSNFPWFFRKSQVSFDNSKYTEYFTHSFYHNNIINSDKWSIIKPIIDCLDIKALVEVRANLIVQKHENILSDFHTDYDFDCNTAIFYINTNNGYTQFKNDKKIKCDENKMIIFNSSEQHAAASQTDEKQRIVLNINYF